MHHNITGAQHGAAIAWQQVVSAGQKKKPPPGSLQLPFSMLRLVLDDLAGQLSDSASVSQAEAHAMNDMSADFRRLNACASAAANVLAANSGDQVPNSGVPVSPGWGTTVLLNPGDQDSLQINSSDSVQLDSKGDEKGSGDEERGTNALERVSLQLKPMKKWEKKGLDTKKKGGAGGASLALPSLTPYVVADGLGLPLDADVGPEDISKHGKVPNFALDGCNGTTEDERVSQALASQAPGSNYAKPVQNVNFIKTDSEWLPWQARLVEIFVQLDEDSSGTLSSEELRKASIAIGVPQARVGRLVKLADKDGSGEIDKEEWIRAIKNPALKELHAFQDAATTKIQNSKTHLLSGGEQIQFPFVLDPHSWKRSNWDIVLALFCIYIAIMLPFVIGWESDLGQVAADNFGMVDRVINYFFLIDICLNFRTGYVNSEHTLVMDWRQIGTHYATTWFLVDLVSSIPFDDISSGDVHDLSWAKLMKLGKLARVAKLMAAPASSEFSSTIEDLMDSKILQNVQRRGMVVVRMALLCHWLACGLKMVDAGCLTKYQDVSLSVTREYLAAIYWSMTTLTTVGYGDIIPTSDGERIYTTFSMVLGGAFYGYVVASITSMIASNDLNATAYYDRMDLIHAWLNKHQELPKEKKGLIRRYFKDFLSEKSAISEADIWQDLSPEMQKEIGVYLVHENVKHNPLFDGMSLGCVVRLQSILRSITMQEGHIVTTAGDAGSAMYIIMSGIIKKKTERTNEIVLHQGKECEAIKSGTRKQKDINMLGPGESFGEEVLLGILHVYEYTTTVMEKAKFQIILADEFINVFATMPFVIDRMRANAFEVHPQWRR